LEARNAARYKSDKAIWSILEGGLRRTRITRNMLGKKPQFQHNEKTRVYVLKDGKGSINWYHYQEVILKPLLIPFAKECLKTRPGTVVQEDGASAHSSRY
jgi:hypothetical protein